MFKEAINRGIHRILGVIIFIPLLIWMSTGLLFHIKHRYDEAYEPLEIPTQSQKLNKVTLSPAQLVLSGKLDSQGPVSLHSHPSGSWIYYGTHRGDPVAVDGISGLYLNPMTLDEGKAWASQAVKNSMNKERYGSVDSIKETTHSSAISGGTNPGVIVGFSGGKEVTVNLLTGEINQTGDLNNWIDFTYRLHYLQWTPWKSVNIVLVLVMSLATLILVFSGISIAIRFVLKKE